MGVPTDETRHHPSQRCCVFSINSDAPGPPRPVGLSQALVDRRLLKDSELEDKDTPAQRPHAWLPATQLTCVPASAPAAVRARRNPVDPQTRARRPGGSERGPSAQPGFAASRPSGPF